MNFGDRAKQFASSAFERFGEGVDRMTYSPNLTLGVSSVQLSGASVGGVCIKKMIENPDFGNEAEFALAAGATVVLAVSGLSNWLHYRAEVG